MSSLTNGTLINPEKSYYQLAGDGSFNEQLTITNTQAAETISANNGIIPGDENVTFAFQSPPGIPRNYIIQDVDHVGILFEGRLKENTTFSADEIQMSKPLTLTNYPISPAFFTIDPNPLTYTGLSNNATALGGVDTEIRFNNSGSLDLYTPIVNILQDLSGNALQLTPSALTFNSNAYNVANVFTTLGENLNVESFGQLSLNGENGVGINGDNVKIAGTNSIILETGINYSTLAITADNKVTINGNAVFEGNAIFNQSFTLTDILTIQQDGTAANTDIDYQSISFNSGATKLGSVATGANNYLYLTGAGGRTVNNGDFEIQPQGQNGGGVFDTGTLSYGPGMEVTALVTGGQGYLGLVGSLVVVGNKLGGQVNIGSTTYPVELQLNSIGDLRITTTGDVRINDVPFMPIPRTLCSYFNGPFPGKDYFGLVAAPGIKADSIVLIVDISVLKNYPSFCLNAYASGWNNDQNNEAYAQLIHYTPAQIPSGVGTVFSARNGFAQNNATMTIQGFKRMFQQVDYTDQDNVINVQLVGFNRFMSAQAGYSIS